VITDFDEELKMLENQLINPRIDKGYFIIESENPEDII
jgi:hypothetical protein